MQEAIPYRSWPAPCDNTTTTSYRASSIVIGSKLDMVNIVSENAVIVLARKGCCMSHVARRLLLALGVNPAVCEIDDDEDEEDSVLNQLMGMICKPGDDHAKDKELLQQLPTVFIGGRLFGGLDKVMATHISGELVPVLKDAGALWL